MRRKRGFTLLELIIVVIVIGILASIALPRYIKVMEKARSAEARTVLGSMRSAQVRYFASHDNYATTPSHLDINFTALNYFNAGTTQAAADPTGTSPCAGTGQANCLGEIQRLDNSGPEYWASIDTTGNITFFDTAGEDMSYLD